MNQTIADGLRPMFVIAATLLLFAGCAVEPVEQRATNNKEIRVGLLFEHEGCRVYRFYDNGRFHYYTVCGIGQRISSFTTQPYGKTVSPQIIDTVWR